MYFEVPCDSITFPHDFRYNKFINTRILELSCIRLGIIHPPECLLSLFILCRLTSPEVIGNMQDDIMEFKVCLEELRYGIVT